LTAGAARDHILGVHGVSGFGEAFTGGGKVVKNVTGYDMPRLLAGSFGTLAAITSVVFKVLPKPETEATLIVPCADYSIAGQIMRAAMQAPCDVSCAAFDPNVGVLLRLEGIAASVTDRKSRLIRLINQDCHEAAGSASSAYWKSIRDLRWLIHGDSIVWKISVPPSDGPEVAQALISQGARVVLDWAGGLVWAEMPEMKNVRVLMKFGQAMVFRAPTEVRAHAEVFQPQPPELFALSRRLKNSLDPKGLFNPGRMYSEF
jgi:glycolate oxidase FAD binding subunit